MDGLAAIVIGGASGLGEVSARALAAQGARVAIFDLDRVRGEAIAAEMGGTSCMVEGGGRHDDNGEHVRMDGAIRM